VQEHQFLEFLEDFIQGDYFRALQARKQEEVDFALDKLKVPGQKYEDLVFLQGFIQGLEFDPFEKLLEELKAKKEKQ